MVYLQLFILVYHYVPLFVVNYTDKAPKNEENLTIYYLYENRMSISNSCGIFYGGHYNGRNKIMRCLR